MLDSGILRRANLKAEPHTRKKYSGSSEKAKFESIHPECDGNGGI
jgi:hypothetical protein